MKKRIILLFSLLALMAVLFAISISAAEPVETWEISATENDSVTAYLYEDTENEGYYTLTISGTGNMKDWTSSLKVPWTSSYGEVIKSIVVKQGVTCIGNYAFANCYDLTNVTISDSVVNIGENVFSYSGNIVSITVDENNSKYCDIDGNLYTGDKKTLIQYAVGRNENVFKIPDCVVILGDSAFASSKLLSVEFPNNLTTIGKDAFYKSSISNITLPNSLETIDAYAFNWCTNLRSVTIPSNTHFIGIGAFSWCRNLTSIKVDESNTNYCDINGTLYTKNKKTLLQYPTGKEDECVELPNAVEIIDDYAFYNCKSLKKVVIPIGVTDIGFSCFAGCDNLTIYCEAKSKPQNWSVVWNSSRPVVWGYFDANSCLSSIFTFKGYSFGWTGSMAVGFEIDYEAIARYEEKTGETLDFGVVFAGFDALGGNMPLDANGNAHADAVKFSTKGYDYIQYDFVITDMTEEYFDISFVISAYICNGAMTKFVQANGLSDIVSGITYNEAKGV